MSISKKAEKELLEISQSRSLSTDMQEVSSQRHNPFFRDGKVDVDAYTEFVSQFNEFINHAPKPFKAMIEKDMKL